MPVYEKLLKQVEELRNSVSEMKEGKYTKNLDMITESQILDIVLNNYKQALMKVSELNPA